MAFAGLARERGRLMADQAANRGGGMLAVVEGIGVVEEVLKSEGMQDHLVIANRNAPRQFVLSGPDDSINKAIQAFERRKITTRRLPVSAAFHSPIVSGATAPFMEVLRAVPFKDSAFPIFANTTAQPYPSDPDRARTLLAEQLARPVAFVEELQAMRKAGATTFLEVGPNSKLTGLVRANLGQEARAIAVDASRGTRGNLVDLASSLAELAAIGYPVLLTRWDEGAEIPSRPTRKPGLTVKVCGANATPAPRTSAPKSSAPTPAPAKPHMTPTPPRIPSPPPAPAPSPVNGEATAHAGRNGHVTNGSLPHPPMPTPLVPIVSSDPGRIADALRIAQDNLVALQKLSEQTAALHRQFLEGQDKTHRTFQSLLVQHQRLTLASVGLEPVAPSAQVEAPPGRITPVVVPQGPERQTPQQAVTPQLIVAPPAPSLPPAIRQRQRLWRSSPRRPVIQPRCSNPT